MAEKPDNRESEYRHDHLDDDELERILSREFGLADWLLTGAAAAIVIAVIAAGIWWLVS